MALIFDTHAIIWMATGDRRLSRNASQAIGSGEDQFVSAVTAAELVDLRSRGRIPDIGDFEDVSERLELVTLDYPAEAWRIIERLPALHGDPVDRMLIAHAIHADLVLVTADRVMRDYPVRSLW